jgi:hypothetical protein
MALGFGIGIPFIRRRGGGPSNTPRTSAFLTATGITDATIISALNAMDTSLISAGLLPAGTGAGKIKALYPIVGGTAATHKFNFVNPLDTDAAFRLVFFGGWTHSANGALPNGTNAYADTFLNPNADLPANNNGFYVYSRTNNTSVSLQGNFDGNGLIISIRGGANTFISSGAFGRVGQDFSDANSFGFYGGCRTSASIFKTYKNGVVKSTQNEVGFSTLPSLKMFIGGVNSSGVAAFFDNRQNAFGVFSEGLNDSENTNFYNLVQAFQTALGRQV